MTVALALSCGRVQDDDHTANGGNIGKGAAAASASVGGTGGSGASSGESRGGSGAGGGGAGVSGASGDSGGHSGASAGSSGSTFAGECSAERTCPGSADTDCVQCLLHGEQACGGPVPPPANCISDADCGNENVICSKAPCANEVCIMGCLSAADCEASHDCDKHHCVPRVCSADADCSANFRCHEGWCARRTCRSSAECNGFCVLDTCQELAGHCAYTCIP